MILVKYKGVGVKNFLFLKILIFVQFFDDMFLCKIFAKKNF